MKKIFTQSSNPVPGDVISGIIEQFHAQGWEFVAALFTGIGMLGKRNIR
jgi:hypothetical protein